MEKIVCLFAIALCGASAASFDVASRISNGNLASENQFPYAVSLQQLNQIQTYTRGHRCGGVLITLQHVLTTASCTHNSVNGVLVQINPAEFRVFAGNVRLINDNVPDRIRFIANFTVHPQFNGATYANDIAIITLNTPFLATTVTPLQVPTTTVSPADATLCTIAGWGSQNLTSTASIDLRYATKFIYNQALCSTLSNYPGFATITSNMLCAAAYDMSAGCAGDIGNALVCNNVLSGILFLTNSCTPSAFPEVYVRVPSYATWISSVTTAGASTFQPGLAVLIMFTLVQLITGKVIS